MQEKYSADIIKEEKNEDQENTARHLSVRYSAAFDMRMRQERERRSKRQKKSCCRLFRAADTETVCPDITENGN